MPRDIIEVAMNKLGVVSNMDAKDLPVDYSVYNKNIDPVQIAGRLRPIKTHSVVAPALLSPLLLRALQGGNNDNTR